MNAFDANLSKTIFLRYELRADIFGPWVIGRHRAGGSSGKT